MVTIQYIEKPIYAVFMTIYRLLKYVYVGYIFLIFLDVTKKGNFFFFFSNHPNIEVHVEERCD